MKPTKPTACLILAAIAVTLTVVASLAQTTTADLKEDKERAEVRTMAQNTLQRFYKAQPLAEAAVQKVAAYAVFSNTGVKILVAVYQLTDKGVAVELSAKSSKFSKDDDLS